MYEEYIDHKPINDNPAYFHRFATPISHWYHLICASEPQNVIMYVRLAQCKLHANAFYSFEWIIVVPEGAIDLLHVVGFYYLSILV